MRDLLYLLYHYKKALSLPNRFKNRAQLVAYQHAKFQKFARRVLTQSPFYRNYVGKPLSAYPIINKKLMMDNFDLINTAGIEKQLALETAQSAEKDRNFKPTIGNITVGLSSGTSGKQGLFLVSKQERLKWAAIILAKMLPGSIYQPHIIAFFLRANSNLYTTLNQGSKIQFNFFDLVLPMKAHFSRLNDLQPDILVAPASVLTTIAHAQNKGLIALSPKKIISVAEVLDSKNKSFIESIFNQPIAEIYQCTEGFLGTSDTSGLIRLNEEYLLIEKEWIDKPSRRFIPIITDFSRTTQPVIRYRLDDILIESETSNLPYTTLASIAGRADDTCYFATNHGELLPIFADVLRQTMARVAASFEDYRIVQHSPHLLEIQVYPNNNHRTHEPIRHAIEKLCQLNTCIMPTLKFEQLTATAAFVKVRRIKRCFTPILAERSC